MQPVAEDGHRYCAGCGRHWDTGPDTAAAAAIVGAFTPDGFEVALSHVTVVGRCETFR